MTDSQDTEEKKILKALLKLQDGYEPHSSGGFDPDDISQHAPGMFWGSQRIREILCNEMSEEGLVEQFEAPMGSPWMSHWLLTAKGREAAV